MERNNKSRLYLKFYGIALFASLLSCSPSNENTVDNSAKYSKKQEVVSTNKTSSFGLIKELGDTLYIDKKVCLKFYISNTKYRLCRGYIDTHEKTNFIVDIKEERIDDLHKQMNMTKDTIKFYFTPAEMGTVNISPITLLLKDNSGNYHIVITSLTYYVAQ
jgi:hypothetical protein